LDKILLGDCLEVLKGLDTNSVDLIATDPPYGYSFMGKDWDKAVPSVDVWRECHRVMKPGAFAFIMSAPRQDVLVRMIFNLEKAGFKTDFTSIYWSYLTGFPKPVNISKAIDKRAGVEREVIGEHTSGIGKAFTGDGMWGTGNEVVQDTLPATDKAKEADGAFGGYQPKPATEIIIVAMKPVAEKTYVDQYLKNGKGVTWLDDVRVPYDNEADRKNHGDIRQWESARKNSKMMGGLPYVEYVTSDKGRFPGNMIISDKALTDDFAKAFSLDKWGQEYEFLKNFPYLTVAKPSRSERDEGLGKEVLTNMGRVFEDSGLEKKDLNIKSGMAGMQGDCGEAQNIHPTVKPVKLMAYLIVLGSRPGDIVLDPYVGSGTTCIASAHLNRRTIGIEQDKEYHKIAQARLDVALNKSVKGVQKNDDKISELFG
jgi:site-specific DNA-methyltransferase (adenine-specific)